MKLSGEPWQATVVAALEAARLEVVRRLAGQGLPTSVSVDYPIVVKGPEEGRTHSDWTKLRRSVLTSHEIEAAISDESVSRSMLGLRPQLEPLALLLDEMTDLGRPQPTGTWPGLTGVEAVLIRVVVPLAHYYLEQLTDVTEPDQALLNRLALEVAEVAQSPTRRHVQQLAIMGVEPSAAVEHRDVRLRSLTEIERGAALLRNFGAERLRDIHATDFVLPARFNMFDPTALLEVSLRRKRADPPSSSSLLQRVVLAFLLMKIDIGTSGIVVEFQNPRWTSGWSHHHPFVGGDRFVFRDQPITEAEFRAVVDFAHRIPDFSSAEGSRTQVVLNRALHGLTSGGAAGYLDLVTALEAALLGDSQTELAYRFKLYGALFLQAERDAATTFADLDTIYRVRSDLIHGSVPRPNQHREAITTAPELVRAVVRRAITSGWPNKKVLDATALAPTTTGGQ